MIIRFSRGFSQTSQQLLRRCGYAAIMNRRTGEASYERRIRRTPYPRFHIYVNAESPTELQLNLHLDAKKPSYEGSHAHSGEYEGAIIEDEASRVRQALERSQ